MLRVATSPSTRLARFIEKVRRPDARPGALNVPVPGDVEPHLEGIAAWFRARALGRRLSHGQRAARRALIARARRLRGSNMR